MTPPAPTPLAVWKAYNDAANAGDHATAGRFVDPDLAVTVNGAPAVSSDEEDRAIQTELIRCYPDYTREYLTGFEHGEWATVEWRMRGTAAPGLELPPLDVAGCSVVRCVDGRLTAARLYHPTGVLDRIVDHALERR